MQTNMNLTVGFKGGQKMNGVAMYDNNSGIRTIGGIVSNSNTLDAEFGLAVFADAADPAQLIIGKSVTMTAAKFRGLLLGNSGIRENMPARASSYLRGTQATAVYFGALWYDTITREDGTTAPVVGDLLSVEDATGKVFTRTTTAGTGFTAIPGSVVEVAGGSVAIFIDGNV